MRTKSIRILIITLLVYIPSHLLANDQPPPIQESAIPSPLSLEKALELLDPEHPDIQIANARLQNAKAEYLHTDSRTDIKSYLDLAAVRARPSISDIDINDSYAELVVTKTIYDFGQSSALSNSFSASVISEENQLVNAQHKHQYVIMERFFNVLLADFKYLVDDEEMTQRYLKYDKLRERAELGMVSNVEVQKAENFYREALDVRVASDQNQRSTRLMLALALNRPQVLPAELIEPDLSSLSQELPEADELYKQALSSNKEILSAQQRVDAAQQMLMAERAGNRPTLSAQLEFGEYEQERASRDTASATLLLRIPLYQAGESRANVDRASAQLFSRKAELR
jgi:outer membrane protein TolC